MQPDTLNVCKDHESSLNFNPMRTITNKNCNCNYKTHGKNVVRIS